MSFAAGRAAAVGSEDAFLARGLGVGAKGEERMGATRAGSLAGAAGSAFRDVSAREGAADVWPREDAATAFAAPARFPVRFVLDPIALMPRLARRGGFFTSSSIDETARCEPAGSAKSALEPVVHKRK